MRVVPAEGMGVLDTAYDFCVDQQVSPASCSSLCCLLLSGNPLGLCGARASLNGRSSGRDSDAIRLEVRSCTAWVEWLSNSPGKEVRRDPTWA